MSLPRPVVTLTGSRRFCWLRMKRETHFLYSSVPSWALASGGSSKNTGSFPSSLRTRIRSWPLAYIEKISLRRFTKNGWNMLTTRYSGTPTYPNGTSWSPGFDALARAGPDSTPRTDQSVYLPSTRSWMSPFLPAMRSRVLLWSSSSASCARRLRAPSAKTSPDTLVGELTMTCTYRLLIGGTSLMPPADDVSTSRYRAGMTGHLVTKARLRGTVLSSPTRSPRWVPGSAAPQLIRSQFS